ncbi:ATP-binding protein [Hymenobacter terricola]|uniref:ATP-binding protein n=1 Tax=Hymenobacter terricola TaxID=2819236 RepID=UPI001B304C3A|nr:ATP-binding protein [Hymenobacter terricola]
MSAYATPSAIQALPAMPLRFDLPEPQDFHPNPEREWPLTTAEKAQVRRLVQEAGLPPEEEILELRRARRDKYYRAQCAWYRWETSREPQPRDFTFEEAEQWFFAEARHYLGTAFVVDDANRRVVRLLCLYVANDPRFETEGGGSLQKGLLLRGGVGCGKTTLLHILARNPRFPFGVTPCRELVQAYAEPGAPGQPAGGMDALRPFAKLHKLSRGNGARYNHRAHRGLALDDIGTENERARHYGSPLNVVEHVICSRHDAVMAGSMPADATHGTTNVPYADYPGPDGSLLPGLGTLYGSRCRSRMRQLFNLIDFPQGAPDRRV